jgi:hypothetical protein
MKSPWSTSRDWTRVPDRHPDHQISAGAPGQLGGGQGDAEVVCGVAGLGRGEEVVHEVHVADQHGVPERGVDRVGLAAADQGGAVAAAEVPDLVAACVDRAGARGREAAGQAVQDVDGQLPARLGGQVFEAGASGVAGERLDLRLVIGRGGALRGCGRAVGLC